MKLLFLCGSLAPGSDGVGDYTRRLAGACAARGHDCTVLALHDPIARSADRTEEEVRLVRLAAATPWSERLDRALQLREQLAPDWVSWQFVAQGLQARGFLPALLLRRASALRGPQCHVMLHELWIGLEARSAWRARATGWLQRRGILCLLDRLDPDRVQTSNPAYREALRREGVEATLLPLFGNVPVADPGAGPAATLARWLPAGWNAPLVAITFGTLHRQWHPAATIAWMLDTAKRTGRRPVLLAAGRTGSHAGSILDAFSARGVAVALTGELPAGGISHLLRAADFGLAPHPWALLGKSGAAAAMLEHGLPVLVPRDDWRLRGVQPAAVATDPLLIRLGGLDDATTDRWLAARRPPESALPATTTQFLETLQSAPGRVLIR